MDDNTIIQLITSSQLSDEDKLHWTSLLPKMSVDQKQELSNILIIKAKVRHAISQIDHALATIEEAEKDVEPQPVASDSMASHTDDLMEKYESIVKSAPQKVDLENMKLQEEQRLLDLRNQLKDLSLLSHGSTPPSASN